MVISIFLYKAALHYRSGFKIWHQIEESLISVFLYEMLQAQYAEVNTQSKRVDIKDRVTAKSYTMSNYRFNSQGYIRRWTKGFCLECFRSRKHQKLQQVHNVHADSYAQTGPFQPCTSYCTSLDERRLCQ